MRLARWRAVGSGAAWLVNVMMPIEQVLAHADELGRVLVVDETRRSGGVGEGVIAGLVEAGYSGNIARVAADDSFIPLGDAANLVLVSEHDIVAAALAMARRPAQPALSWEPPSPRPSAAGYTDPGLPPSTPSTLWQR